MLVVAALVLIASLAPGASRWMPWYAPLRTHLLLYGVLGLGAACLWRACGRRGWPGIALVMLIGVLSELAQLAVPARTFRIGDLLVNTVAALLGGLLGIALWRLGIRRRAQTPPLRDTGQAARIARALEQLLADRLAPVAGLLADRGLIPAPLAMLAGQADAGHSGRGNAPEHDARVLEALADAGVRVLLLKGTLLAHTVYPDPGMRLRGDTDVLVAPAERRRAEQVLAGLGLKRSYELTAKTFDTQDQWSGLIDDRMVVIDLHWALINHPALIDCFDFEALWQRRVPLSIGSVHAWGLDPVDALLHAAVHYYAHHGDDDRPAQWLFDGDLLYRSLETAGRHALATRAEALGLGGVLAAYLDRVEQRFATGIDGRWLARLREAGRSSRLTTLVRLGDRPLASMLFQLRSLPDRRARVAFVRRLLIPSAAYLRAKYPDAPRWALPWLYLRRVLDAMEG